MSDNIVRVYPIRTTKKEWNIPIYCYHQCNQRCSQMYVREETNDNTIRYILVDNPDYINNKCTRYSQLEKTLVQINSYDIDNPMGITGPLYNPDMIVIPDKHFSVHISYPLLNPINVDIRAHTVNGFTLRELLYSIKTLYQYIYNEEERTSTPRSYHLKKLCNECHNKNSHDYVKNIDKPPNSDCSICYNSFTTSKQTGKLDCGHIYHNECIFKWFETATTCPLCRSQIVKCDICNGTGTIYYDYNGVVIPIEHRGSILNRNTTDGIFGIFGHDLEDLVIENIHYNRTEKVLTMFIGS